MPAGTDVAPSAPLGLLLAAGSGTRFGGGKLVHPFGLAGEPLAVVAYRNLLAVLPRVVVVVRAGDAPVRAAFEQVGAEIAVCTDAAEGMGRSLACGARHAPDAAGWIVALGDMPLLRAATIRAIADALATGASVAIPVHAGRRGHPVGFAAHHGPALQALTGDEGARSIVARHREAVREIAVDDAGIHADVDTREDARQLSGRA